MNTIKLFSDINTRTTDLFRRADDTQPLYIALDSVGGSVYEAFKIYDLIRERQQPTFVNVVGYCYSAASVILLAAILFVNIHGNHFLCKKHMKYQLQQKVL